MPERLQLPIAPSGPQLGAHVAALDLLAARLDALPSRSRWPARVPLNSKASFEGEVVHTNEIKVNVSGDWWVEMSAHEAADYVRRRRDALLHEQARLMDGKPPSTEDHVAKSLGLAMRLNPEEIKFDPLFAHPVKESKRKHEEKAKEKQKEKAVPAPAADDLPDSLQRLVDLVGTQMQDKLNIPSPTGGKDTVETDEGLPIHEIREALDGSALTPMPEGEGEGAVTLPEEDGDYWSEEAVARREELRRRIFHDGSDTEEDDDDDMDVDAAEEAKPPTPPVAHPAASASTASLVPPEDVDMGDEPTPSLSRSSSISQPPKSILKAPSRKKSVSFDASVPLPPDSPPVRGMPIGVQVPDSGPKTIPILNAPKPGQRKEPFGGFRRGFLQAGPPPVPQIVEVPPDAPAPAPVQEDTPMEAEPAPQPKKQSLFAQRRAQAAGPSFPKLADTPPMVTMKHAVQEKSAVPVAPSRPLNAPPSVGPARAAPDHMDEDTDDDDDEYGDLGEFSDDEEDEYNLDEALLAREVALEYHRRQAYQKPVDPDEVDPEAEDANVLMGIPRVSTISGQDDDSSLRIVNPTADDLSQFLRVGRAEDGELVFEQPVVDDNSDSDGEAIGADADDRRQRRQRRKDVMAQLLTGDYSDRPLSGAALEQVEKAKQAAFQQSLPPAVAAAPAAPAPVAAPAAPAQAPKPDPRRDVVERVAPPQRPAAAPQPEAAAAAAPAPAPKKVSRFKAARGQ
ncbi:Nuclear envelope morphology protein 1 [Vanrija albida]|uniref:Nuclear envelope morphology protein 1 n=1 Tax=Vanrija albida TaxID=181172 RepID=A0ABR3QDQ8_9TREE